MLDTSTPHSQRIMLRSVGERVSMEQKLKKYDSFCKSLVRQQNNTSEQIQLLPGDQNIYKKLKRSEGSQSKFNLIEDPRQSEFTFRKCVLFQKILLIFTIFYIFLCIVRTELNNRIAYAQDRSLVLIMSLITVMISKFTLDVVILIFMRSVSLNQLRIDQKRIYCVRKDINIFGDIQRFLKSKQNILTFVSEVIMLSLHPNLATKDIKIQIFETYDELFMKHDLNDILCITSLFRVYLIIRALIYITQYSTPRAARLCSYNRVQHNLLYSIKCLIQEHPLWSISVVFLTQMIILGYGMRISQGTVIRDNPNLSPNGFENYVNCFWCIFITMTTVGYGDYYPKTIAGRMIIVFAATSGIIVSSLLIVSLSAYLKMQPNQVSSHLTLIRLGYQQQLKQKATQALLETMKLSTHLTSSQKNNQSSKIKNLFTNLKSKIDNVKYRNRQIKSMVNNNNIIEEMYRLFQLLKDNLAEIYKNQAKLKLQLSKLSEPMPPVKYNREASIFGKAF